MENRNLRLIDPKSLIIPEDFVNHWAPERQSEEYHADKSAVGSSSLVLILSSPRAFLRGHVMGKRKEETNDMRIGKIVHMGLLEPAKFKNSYRIMPVFEGYTKDGKKTTNPNAIEVKEKRAAWEADLPKGCVVITDEEFDQIIGMVESVSEHPQGKAVFTNGIPEMAGYYRDPRTGIKMKIMPDFRANDNFMITDYKTTVNADQTIFGSKAFGEWRYDLRIWMYAYGTSLIENKPMPKNLFFMVNEKTEPYEAAVYYMTPEQCSQAEYDYNDAMDKLKACIETDSWPMRQARMEPLWTPKKFIDADVRKHEKELDNVAN